MKYDTYSQYDPVHPGLAESAFLTVWASLSQWHNSLVLHSSLDKVPPVAVYFGTPYNAGPKGRRDPVPILLRPESGGANINLKTA